MLETPDSCYSLATIPHLPDRTLFAAIRNRRRVERRAAVDSHPELSGPQSPPPNSTTQTTQNSKQKQKTQSIKLGEAIPN